LIHIISVIIVIIITIPHILFRVSSIIVLIITSLSSSWS
jgi:hypothetical protein